jgi:hypothetical protein
VTRCHQLTLIISTLVGSWFGMQAVHELGHVLGAMLTGAEVTHVELSPWAISRTDVTNNTRPLVVAWAGPIVGVVLPLVIWHATSVARLSFAFVLRFFAGFCLVANGLYIGLGSFGRIGDAGDMLRQGSPVWLLWLFGAITVLAGLWLWHGLGPAFGWGLSEKRNHESDESHE